MLQEKFSKTNFILASKSPRRQKLLKLIGIDYVVYTNFFVEETFPNSLKEEKIALYLACLKADSYNKPLLKNDILITADTIVIHNNKVINKPADETDAYNILKMLSNSKHTVYTGVCIKSNEKIISFYSKTNVWFRDLDDEEILFYIENYKPFDKAGAYGIQEWIGYIGVERIDGSFYNVMGLPIEKVYYELKNW
ncbi:MAG: Maf-like protein [Marinilabiliales bacterium]